jgi:hypothetical protein
MRESRNEAFKTAFSTIPVTAAVEPGYFDKYDDPIKKLGEMQVHAKNIATDLFTRSGASPGQLKGINSVVLHSKEALAPGTQAAYVKNDSSIHVAIARPTAATAVTHELGHHVNDHKTPEELHTGGLKIHNILSRVGGYEAEADHFANPNSPAKNTYVHAVTHHLTGACEKEHGGYSHNMLKILGQGYADRMKQINPTIHQQLTGGANNGN